MNHEFGFGAHFLLDDDNTPVTVDVDSGLNAPPDSDITNPRCKFCRTCNRDFNRRQAFVEHCRNVHKMKINLAPGSPGVIKGTPTTPSSGGTSRQSCTCQYCGKVFSNTSNRNRHIILSCEAKNGGNVNNGASPVTSVAEPEPEPEKPKEPEKCPYPDCYVTHVRSALMKRHLFEAHQIQPLTISLPNIEEEKKKLTLSPSKIKMEVTEEAVDERKVPPLRVKISGLTSLSPTSKITANKDDTSAPEEDIPATESVIPTTEEDTTASEADLPASEADLPAPEADTPAPEADTPAPEADTSAPEVDTPAPEADTVAPEADTPVPEATPAPAPAAPKSHGKAFKCKTCKFSTNNNYILGRHQQACLKKSQLKMKVEDNPVSDNIEESVESQKPLESNGALDELIEEGIDAPEINFEVSVKHESVADSIVEDNEIQESKDSQF